MSKSTMANRVWHTENGAEETTYRGSTTKMPPTPPPKQKNFKELMGAYWQRYCQRSSIHGVRYLYDPTLTYIERLIWSTLVFTCVVLTWTSCIVLGERYNAKKLQTVVENPQYPVFRIDFPAVAVCPHNRINWDKFPEAKRRFLPNNASTELQEIFTTFVKRMESLSFGHFESFENLEDINLEALQFLDVTELAHFLAPNCDDIFVKGSCRWRKSDFDCCDLFIMEPTEWGYCLVFNSLLSDESKQLQQRETPAYYPKHNSMAGQGTGLNFYLHLDAKLKRERNLPDESILIVIKKADQWWDNGYTITPNTESYVIIRPEMTDIDNSTRSIKPEQRNCLFVDEKEYSGFKTLKNVSYRQANCLNVCHEEHLIQFCNCTLPLFFPPNDKASICKPADFRCLAKNNDIFGYDKRKEEDAFFSAAKPGMTCLCLISCRSVQYFASITTLPLIEDTLLIVYKVAGTLAQLICAHSYGVRVQYIHFCSTDSVMGNSTDVDVFKVDVHYQAEVLVRYRTSLEFTNIDLLANFGGIFGLWLGASIVSGVELFYYLTFGFALYLYNNSYYSVMRAEVRDFWRRVKQHWHNFVTGIDQQRQHQQEHQHQHHQQQHGHHHHQQRHQHQHHHHHHYGRQQKGPTYKPPLHKQQAWMSMASQDE